MKPCFLGQRMSIPQRQDLPPRHMRILVIVCVLVGLLAFSLGMEWRFSDLGSRPMHTDEAVHGIKLIQMIQDGKFTYDPSDYHGPTLHYTTAFVMKLLGWTPETLSDTNLRVTIGLWGVLLLMLAPFLHRLWPLSTRLSRNESLSMIVATTVIFLWLCLSPAMVYFSRYYIMEIILIALLLLALLCGVQWRLSRSHGWIWASLLGISIGAMHATKETFVISMGGVFVAYFTARIWPGGGWRQDLQFIKTRKFEVFLVIFTTLLTSMALFSSGFQDWKAIVDSYRTYWLYFHRAEGAGGHEKPWSYYLNVLFYWKSRPISFGEPLTGLLSILSIGWLLKKGVSPALKIWTLGLWGYTLSVLAVYSIIPYKTPWSILPVHLTFILLAGLGSGWAWSSSDQKIIRWITRLGLILMVTIGIHQFTRQNFFANHRLSSDPRNPFVYSHTVPSTRKLIDQVIEVSKLEGRGDAMPIQIFERSRSAWPLPWYLRHFKSVGYWDKVDSETSLHAPIVITEMEMVEDLPANFKEQYVPEMFGLMPNRILILWAQKDLRELWLTQQIEKNS